MDVTDITNGGADRSNEITVGRARPADYDAVRSFTANTWPERGGDYIPEVYHDWIADDGDTQRTFVVRVDEGVHGICQGVMLSPYEAWAQGMRVDPAYQGRGLSARLNDALFEWAAANGAAVCRNMVFSWNSAGLGGSRAAGFSPRTEFRWAHPRPSHEANTDADAGVEANLSIREAPDAAWSYWQRSDACDALGGLALDREESWALSALTRAALHRAATETRLFTVQNGGVRGFAYRVRDYERESRSDEENGNDGGESAGSEEADAVPETERWAEYGVGAWADVDAARSLFRAISRDAAAIGADRTRVLIPETPRHVSDAAVCRVETDSEPDFVFEADLTDRPDHDAP